MQALKETFRELRPVIFVAWILAAARLLVDHTITDIGWLWGISVYFGVPAMLMLCGFTGLLDHLGWKRWLLGGLVLGLTCWFLPNWIAYTTAQFTDPGHGRFEIIPLQQELTDEGELGPFEIAEEVKEKTGRSPRGPAIAPTTGGKLLAGFLVAVFTLIAGTVWCVVWMVVAVGIPATARKSRGG